MATEVPPINLYQYVNWLQVQLGLCQIEAERPSASTTERTYAIAQVQAYQTALRAVAFVKIPKCPES